MYKNNMNRQTKTLEKQKKDRLLKQSMSPCIFLSIGVFLLSSVDFHLKNQLYCIKVHYTYSYLKYCERCMWLHIQVLIPSMFKGWSWEQSSEYIRKKKSFPYRTQILVGIYVAGGREQRRREINKFLKHTVLPPSTLGESRTRKIADYGR